MKQEGSRPTPEWPEAGVVAAGNPATAQAAASVLELGGNAVDGAVAGALASFVAEPLLSSAGGAGMMTVAVEGHDPVVVDFFSTAPGQARGPGASLDFVAVEVDFGPATQTFHVGRGSAAAPSALDGLAEAARRFGRLPLQELAKPAVDMAREGVPVSPQGAAVFRLLWPILSRDSETVRVLGAHGAPPAAGHLQKNPELSACLLDFAREGKTPEAVLQALLSTFGPAHGGVLTPGDVAPHVKLTAPLLVDLGGGSQALTSPRVGGRVVASSVAELIRSARGIDEPAELLRLAEVSREAHRERTALTAPGSTTHVSVLDVDGGAASVTLTNGEGSGHMIPGTGIQVNNFLGEEDLNPHGYHLHRPGAPLPTMIAPTVVLTGGVPTLALGSGGSNRIRSAVSQVLYRVAQLGEALPSAVDAPRIHAEGGHVWVELDGLEDPRAAEEALRIRFDKVHTFEERDFFFGGVHGVLRAEDGSLIGAADSRRGGAVVRARAARSGTTGLGEPTC